MENRRKDFPILGSKVNGRPLVYLDNAATTQKPEAVVDKIRFGYYNVNANIHRGVHYLSREATAAHEEARATVRQFINARSSAEIIFTRGTTEAINLIASSYPEEYMSEGDEIILTEMEHHSNIVPWQMQAIRKGLSIKVVPVTEDGELDIEAYRSLLSERTRIVALTHVSNVLGTINPVKEIIALAHRHNIPVLLDGAQAAAHIAIDVQDLDVDFYAFSAHKIYGPTGIGILYGKEKYLDRIPPYQGGGEMISTVSFEKTTYNELPFKFEAGTPDYIGSTAMAEALRYISGIGLEPIATHEQALHDYAVAGLKSLGGIRIFGQAKHKSAVLSFLPDGIHHYDAGVILDHLGIAVRTGHHCAQPLMKAMNVEGMIRASFAFYNTKEEVDLLIAGLKQVQTMFNGQNK